MTVPTLVMVEAVAAYRDTDQTLDEIGEATGVTGEAIGKRIICYERLTGETVVRRGKGGHNHRKANTPSAVTLAMVEAYRRGQTLEEVGTDFNVSSETVRRRIITYENLTGDRVERHKPQDFRWHDPGESTYKELPTDTDELLDALWSEVSWSG